MRHVKLTIDEIPVVVEQGSTILQAAQSADKYIPTLCAHPDLPPAEMRGGAPYIFRGSVRLENEEPHALWRGCGICVVDASGEHVRACATEAADGMNVVTTSADITSLRRERLFAILEHHPHACLTCAQAEGCPRTQCSTNVPEEERCCELLGSCELQRIARYVGVPEHLPRYKSRALPSLVDEPLFDFHTELCIGCLRCVRACQDLRGVGTLSYILQNGLPHIGTTGGPTRSESNCRFCGACVEVCSTGALMDKVRAVGAERNEVLVPCRNACPAGIDIPRYVRHIARNEPAKALGIIREKLPLVHSVSNACFHPCEEVCRRSELNAPVSICRLKKNAAENDSPDWRSRQKQLTATGKRIAVVGSGPAGLTAAYYLTKQGHCVTVFESLAQPGGMLRVGIPEYRLPVAALERDIEEIRSAGVEIRCSSPVTEADLDRLIDESDAVFIATGAHAAKRIELPGADLTGVYWGVEFLRERALGNLPSDAFQNRRVIVVGGGNVAMDAARVARRLGAEHVSLVCIESEDELPAWDWEVKEAIDESISLTCRYGPSAIRGENRKVKSLVCSYCMRVFDEEGVFHPAFDHDRTLVLDADIVILAIGQNPSTEYFTTVGLDRNGRIEIDAKTFATRTEKVFAGGDVASGPSSIIEAVAAGRRAAAEIDKALGGDGDIDEQFVGREPADKYLGRVLDFANLTRYEPAIRAPEERARSFCAIEQPYNPEQAAAEALRCLSCDLRLDIHPVRPPPYGESMLALEQAVADAVPDVAGVYQLLDADQNVVAIKGVLNLRAGLNEVIEEQTPARFFLYEIEPMYTRRESELIQQHLQKHGELPGAGADDLDDLF